MGSLLLICLFLTGQVFAQTTVNTRSEMARTYEEKSMYNMLDSSILVDAKGKIISLDICSNNWGNPEDIGPAVFFIYMNEIPAHSSGYKRVVISSNHPAYKEIVALAIKAYENQWDVRLFVLNSSIIRSNSWDFGILSII